jgi:drug/metabolite transporter (DMT)-like permease
MTEGRMNKNTLTRKGIVLAILAAALYALNSPLSKLLLSYMPPMLMAGFLYIGAGAGMAVIALVRRCRGIARTEERFDRSDLPYVLAMILLDIAAPILLLVGLSRTTAANASLLNNFEIVATALIALAVFGERISARLWTGIGFVTASCILLTLDGTEGLRFSSGSIFVLLACICWGIENNCTRRLSSKDPLEIVLLKGIFSGLGSVTIGFVTGEKITHIWSIFAVLAVGCVAYGFSIFTYVYAQRFLGAARTSTYYAIAPFIGVMLSLAIFKQMPSYTFFIALVLMAIGAWLASSDKPIFKNKSEQ